MLFRPGGGRILRQESEWKGAPNRDNTSKD